MLRGTDDTRVIFAIRICFASVFVFVCVRGDAPGLGRSTVLGH